MGWLMMVKKVTVFSGKKKIRYQPYFALGMKVDSVQIQFKDWERNVDRLEQMKVFSVQCEEGRYGVHQ